MMEDTSFTYLCQKRALTGHLDVYSRVCNQKITIFSRSTLTPGRYGQNHINDSAHVNVSTNLLASGI